MRNSFKTFFPTNLPKFQVVKFNLNGHNSAIRLNLFSNASVKQNSIYNAMMLPVFDNKSFYSNFTYKYFSLKWAKFEQKNNYYRYVKTPSAFPSFLTSTNYFINSFLTRRRKKRVYNKRRKIRVSVYFTNRFLRSTRSILRAYRLRPFYGKKKIFRLRKKLIRPLAKRKTFKVIFSKYWIRRRWYKFYRRRNRNKKFYRFASSKFKKKKVNKNTFYFKKRSYRFRVFRFFGFKKNLKKIMYARRYAYRKVRKLKKSRNFNYKSIFLRTYKAKNFSKKIFKLQFFKKLVKKIIKRKYFVAYLGHKLNYKIRSRIFFNKYGILRFLGFKNHLLATYFNLVRNSHQSVRPKSSSSYVLNFFHYFFVYPQKLHYSKNNFYFKFFAGYNLLKNNKLKRFKNYFDFNLKQYFFFFKVFRDFFSMISIFKLNFLPFNFWISKKKYFKKFESRISSLQYVQRRKLARNLRFCTYFFLLIRITQLKRGTKFYRRITKKLLKFIYRRSKSGRMLFFLPFVLNKFIYFGLLSHVNSNIYFRDPTKFNDFYSTKLRKSKFILYNKV